MRGYLDSAGEKITNRKTTSIPIKHLPRHDSWNQEAGQVLKTTWRSTHPIPNPCSKVFESAHTFWTHLLLRHQEISSIQNATRQQDHIQQKHVYLHRS